MGYEATRFTDNVDEEFYCSICTMVLKEPTQSPCDHLFCSECINGWLAVNQSCPVERGPLQLDDLKPASRTVRNLMNKLEIKCDFESKGCASIVKLENLQNHVGICEYNPNATVICDKGCDIQMRREEYETNNCFKHFAAQAVRQHEKILNQHAMIEKLNDEVVTLRDAGVHLRRQQENSVNQMIRQNDEIATLNDQVQNQSTEIQRLNDELNLRGDTISRLNEALNELRMKESSKFSNGNSNPTNILVSKPPEFRVWSEMKICTDQPNVLEVDYKIGFAQSVYSLKESKFSFKIEILSLGACIQIGLAPKCRSDRRPSFGFGVNSISYWSDGNLFIKNGNFTSTHLTQWKAGDIIECGINCPSDFVNDGRLAPFYFKKNGKLVYEKLVVLMDKLFPTVHMYEGSKIRFLRN